MPAASSLRASPALSLAAAKDNPGYTPTASNFSLPAKRNFKRQYFLPSGIGSRNSPSPSNS